MEVLAVAGSTTWWRAPTPLVDLTLASIGDIVYIESAPWRVSRRVDGSKYIVAPSAGENHG